MADAALAPRSPLEGLALPAELEFTLAEAPAAARFILRGREAARAVCERALGVELPSRLGRAGEGGARAGLWLGPDEWLLIAEGADPAALGAGIETALTGNAHSLVDVSHRQIGLVATGTAAARALSAGCPLDLSLSAFPIGMATRTIFDKAEIVLWRRGESVFHVEVWRSFAPYLVAALAEAAGPAGVVGGRGSAAPSC
jgi:sarcosine oxidase subunit gamma